MPEWDEDFDKVEAETKPLKKTIGGEQFEFPGAPSADVTIRFYSALAANPKVNVSLLCVFLFEQMVGEETLERLVKLTSVDGVEALALGLFKHYRLVTKPTTEVSPPKEKGGRSRKRSAAVSG